MSNDGKALKNFFGENFFSRNHSPIFDEDFNQENVTNRLESNNE